MDDDDRRYYEASLAERARLHVKLSAYPEWRLLQTVDLVIADYEAIAGRTSATMKGTEAPKIPDQPESLANIHVRQLRAMQTRVRGALSGKGKRSGPIIEAAAAYLKQKKVRAQSSEIAVALQQQGIPISGKKPAGVVSSYLSQSALFDNEPGVGYGLVEWRGDQRDDTGILAGCDIMPDPPPELPAVQPVSLLPPRQATDSDLEPAA